MAYSIDEIKKIVKPIAKSYEVDQIWLFGSYARNEARPDSDLDLRVHGGSGGYFRLSGLYRELQDALGLKLDLETTDSLDDDFLAYIAKDEILIYER